MKLKFNELGFKLMCGDSRNVLRGFPDESVDCCVTSPPYYNLRNYGIDGQIGNECTPEQYLESLNAVFREVKRVLKSDGTLWVNIGDSYWNEKDQNVSSDDLSFGRIKAKDKIGIPWMMAFMLRNDGWFLRQDIIWNKPNPMPDSVKDRCTCAHEYVFMFSKSLQYHYDADAIKERANYELHLSESKSECILEGQSDETVGTEIKFGGNKYGENNDSHYATKSGKSWKPTVFYDEKSGQPYVIRNKRDVWTLATTKKDINHFAAYPVELVEPCILSGCVENGIVLDPFNGSGTTGIAALKNGRKYVGIELNPEYVKLTEERFDNDSDINQTVLF